jgi:hypothetical protein
LDTIKSVIKKTAKIKNVKNKDNSWLKVNNVFAKNLISRTVNKPKISFECLWNNWENLNKTNLTWDTECDFQLWNPFKIVMKNVNKSDIISITQKQWNVTTKSIEQLIYDSNLDYSNQIDKNWNKYKLFDYSLQDNWLYTVVYQHHDMWYWFDGATIKLWDSVLKTYVTSDFVSKQTLPLNSRFYIQLNWLPTYNNYIKDNFDIYDFDLFELNDNQNFIKQLKNDNKKIICYFSAWTYENWRDDIKNWINDKDYKKYVWKSLWEWPWENWLDISQSIVFDKMKSRIDLAKKIWCDWIDPDNVDWYTQDSGFNITFDNQYNYNKKIADYAHSLWLLVWLKNDLDQIKNLHSFFDFAVNEQCSEFNECWKLQEFISSNKPVYNLEYVFNNFQKSCSNISIQKNAFQTIYISQKLNWDIINNWKILENCSK